MDRPRDHEDEHEPLTAVPGRKDFYRDIQGLVDESQAGLVLMSTEIEGLDFVLRTFGPSQRDTLVKEVGHRLRTAAGEEHLPYHISQGCFALVLTNSNYRAATRKARLLGAALKKPFSTGGAHYHLRGHIGISHYPSHAETIEELVRTSAFACHMARENQSDYATFDHEWDKWEQYRFRLVLDLEHALAQETGIDLAFQPVVDLQSGHCAGVEGLCRWNHSQLGPIAPNDFLPYVEQTPLMMGLTETTLGIGLQYHELCRKRGFDGTLAINLSPALFRQPDLLDRLQEQFRFFNTPKNKVHFEITETGIMEQPKRAIQTLKTIQSWGCKVAVDDFGTGHSSLAYLADLPIDLIKIDKHFIQNLSLPWGEAIVGATAMLADKLGLQTVGEGIEDEQQYRKCRDLGVTFGQGYHIARPMAKKDFEEWLKNRNEDNFQGHMPSSTTRRSPKQIQ